MEGDALDPIELNILDDDVLCFEDQLKMIFGRIKALHQWLHPLLGACIAAEDAIAMLPTPAEQMEEVPPADMLAVEFPPIRKRLEHLCYRWTVSMLSDMEQMREVRYHRLDKRFFATLPDGTERTLRTTLGMHVFAELTNMRYLLYFPTYYREKRLLHTTAYLARPSQITYSLENTKHPMWIDVAQSLDTSDTYANPKSIKDDERDVEADEIRKSVNQFWKRPILTMKQSELRLLIMFVTQQLNDVPTRDVNAVKEYQHVVELIWIRSAMLQMELLPVDVMDDQEMRMEVKPGLYAKNRAFCAFCTFYLSEVARRSFHWLKLKDNTYREESPELIAKATEKVYKWVEHAVTMFPDEAFDQLYEEVQDLGYAYVGDDAWFRFSMVGKIHSRTACIHELRPHMRRRYFRETRLNSAVVLKNARSKHLARLFVLRAVDEHLRSLVPNLHWSNGVQVESDGIEMTRFKLENPISPMLVQVFSSYWPYHNGKVHVCDDVYEAIAVWWLMLRRHYSSHLSEFYLGRIFEEIFGDFKEQVPPHQNRAAPVVANEFHFEI